MAKEDDGVTSTSPAERAANVAAKEAEARRHSAEARKLDAEAQQAEIALERAQEARSAEIAGNHYNHVYYFHGQVASQSVNACLDKLTVWARVDPGCDIEVVFNSPGGSVIDGLALYDFLQVLRRQGHRVITSTYGYAASMAGILLQAGDERTMSAESWLMIHEASFGAGGKIGEVEDTVEWVKRVEKRIADIFAARCAGASAETATKRLSRSQLIHKWTRKDWWLSSDEALAYGLIDTIR